MKRMLLFAICFWLTAGAALGGTFRMTRVWYTGFINQLNKHYYTVIVNGRAKYYGTVDSNDNHWLIQTHLFDGYGYVTSGYGLNGSGIPYTGYVIECTGGYAASASLFRRDCDEFIQNYYFGEGGVVIYHQFWPEISTMLGWPKDVPCYHECPGHGVERPWIP